MAPNGLGSPVNDEHPGVSQENRARRTTTASSTAAAAAIGRGPPSPVIVPQATTKNAGAKPKLITSARLSSSAPMPLPPSLRATRPSNRSQAAARSSRTTAVATAPRSSGPWPPAAMCADCAAASCQTAMNPHRALPRVR